MERDMNQSAMPTVCRGGCGFYGSPATDGFCSKCFKDSLKRKQDTGLISPSASMTPKATLASTIENLVAPNQASCSSVFAAAASANTSEKVETSPSPDIGQQAAPGDEKYAESTPPPQKQKNRCDVCRKRVGLTGFDCRCGGMFCGSHRYSDTHECSFDYKALGEQEIRKNNPVVKTEKVVKL